MEALRDFETLVEAWAVMRPPKGPWDLREPGFCFSNTHERGGPAV